MLTKRRYYADVLIERNLTKIRKTRKMKKAFTLIELLIVVAILAILGALVVGAGGGCDVSDGTRSGTLQKFSSKGLMRKSYEGELLLGGMKRGESMGANVWQFSVTDRNIAQQLDGLVGQTITVKYHQALFHNPLLVNTSYSVISVSTNKP